MAKGKRVGFKIDMTPMVDVGFLLLTFFMLTTSFKPPEDVEVLLPASHSAFKLPDSDVITLLIAKDGRVFMGVDAQQMRMALFGPAAKLKATILVKTSDLPNLLIHARTRNPKLRTVIKADKDVEYGTIEEVMNILQKVSITRFNLVTDIEK